MLYPFFKDSGDRDVMMNTVAPVWDGNETWLVLGGAALFGGLPAGLRGGPVGALPAVDLHARRADLPRRRLRVPLQGQPAKQHIWDKAFIGGSLVATFFQGVALGAFIEGIGGEPQLRRRFAGLDRAVPAVLRPGPDRRLHPARLHLADHEDRRPPAGAHARPGAPAGAGAAGDHRGGQPVDAAGPHAEIAARWFSLPNLFWFLPVPILVLVTFYALLRSVANNDHVKPFVLTLVLIFLGYSGLGISLWPNIIRRR